MTPLEKARQARTLKAQSAIWAAVQQSRKLHNCRCDLREGMSHEDLRSLGLGCVPGGRYICPTLDTYRRLLPPSEVPEDERALQESA